MHGVHEATQEEIKLIERAEQKRIENEKEGNRVLATKRKTTIQYSSPTRKSGKTSSNYTQHRVVVRMNKSRHDSTMERLDLSPKDLISAQPPASPASQRSRHLAMSPRSRRFAGNHSIQRIKVARVGKQDHELIRMFAAP